MFRALAILAALMLASGGAAAQPAGFQPVELTEDSASRAIAAMPDLYEVARSYDGVIDKESGSGMVDGFTRLATSASAHADLAAAVAAHGFPDYSVWVSVIQSVFHTYAYAKSAGAMEQLGPAMDMAMQQMMASPSLSEAQKSAIMAQMGAASPAIAGMQANAPSPGNLEVVAALEPEIERMMEYLRAER
jgi:hypothetical protein